MQNEAEAIYKDSWINKYYDYDVKIENGVIFFWDKVKKIICESKRFSIYIYIPEETKTYFFPLSYWKVVFGKNYNAFLRTDLISKVNHGFLVSSFPNAKSLYYQSPFFISLKTQNFQSSNFLTFNNFFKTNEESTMLAMIDFNEDKNSFETIFAPEVVLPNSFFNTNNVLEIKIFDSLNESVKILDYSQIFIILIVD